MLPIDEARAHLRALRRPIRTTRSTSPSDDGAVVGSFALLVMDNLGHLGAPSAIVEDVVVAPDVQGGGIGQRHDAARARATRASKGCYKLVLSSNAKRERAHAFYEQLGFERHGFSFRVTFAGGRAMTPSDEPLLVGRRACQVLRPRGSAAAT